MLIGFEKKWRCHELTLNETIQVDEHLILRLNQIQEKLYKNRKQDLSKGQNRDLLSLFLCLTSSLWSHRDWSLGATRSCMKLEEIDGQTSDRSFMFSRVRRLGFFEGKRAPTGQISVYFLEHNETPKLHSLTSTN